MKVLPYITSVTFLFLSSLSAQAKITKEDYIAQWSKVAIEQMHAHKIPASITMAQGILESSYGNSMLATEANNHFGIKCHSWEGERVYKDDDKKDECFRKYAHALESFEDHSLFLTGRSRYAELFTYDVTDYKSWAKGLRKAGYATNPKYPQLLIDIIEKNELYKLDFSTLDQPLAKVDIAEQTLEEVSTKAPQTGKLSKAVNYNLHKVTVNKARTQYITAKKGDTYYRIAKEFGLSLHQIYKYNDVISKQNTIEEGDKIYIMHKRNRSKKERTTEVKNATSLRAISQEFGIKLKRLQKLNPTLSPSKELAVGTTVFLR
ncbi:Flagellum-specific peptidoglycan hydrolase FlgJ [Lishizhenia tianjinensis]|uniref:Peptidoglycan hydrolase n=1 Tax=Lishizhenia tianjinensis TaxID=477690 RepID=A0A1I6YER3_9FLAO|nr:glucosaminidase domain-containing protein [Lishizhenia tianjinensis]SFT49026.1 Flagellum-specific peptidoglycan hydrolase FlgJ [Lishizhenia tianjinensis]